MTNLLTNFLTKYFENFFTIILRIFWRVFWQVFENFLLSNSNKLIFLTFNRLTIAIFTIGVPSILFTGVFLYFFNRIFFSLSKYLRFAYFIINVIFTHCCTSKKSHSKNLTSLFPLILLSKHISFYALVNSRYFLTFKSIFQAKKTKKLARTSLNV
jgi:hypothetical protein